jgi:trimethylamine:corrinoid methyltransferase-like protein
VIAGTKPGDHFLTSRHTLRHCRSVHRPGVFLRATREGWERQGKKELLDRCRERYRQLMSEENAFHPPEDAAEEIDAVVQAADRQLVR